MVNQVKKFRRLRILVWVATLIVSSQAYSLGIGEIELKSNLGEPLQAILQLHEAHDLGRSEIIIRKASKQMNSLLGFEADSLFVNLKFELLSNQQVLISTHESINEPFLNFILEIRWPQGEAYKEFKLFIDPA